MAIVKLTSTLKATAEWQKVDRTRLAQRLCGFKHFYTSTVAVKRAGNELRDVALHESTCKLYGEEGSLKRGPYGVTSDVTARLQPLMRAIARAVCFCAAKYELRSRTANNHEGNS